MFTTIFKHEINYWLRQPLPYIFALFLFALSFLTMWGMASEASTGAGAAYLNSYYKLVNMSSLFLQPIIFILPAIVGVAIYRDYSSKMYTVLYAFPFSKGDYLAAKFFSSLLVTTVIVSMMGLGFALGTVMPGVKTEVLHAFDINAYVHLYGVYVLPTILLYAAIVFAIVTFTRNIYIGFVAVILLIVLQGISNGVFNGGELRVWADILDPTGSTAMKNMVRYWPLQERNMQSLPFSGMILINRIFWLLVSVAVMFITYRKFQFHQFATTFSRKKKVALLEKKTLFSKVQRINLPTIKTNFSWLNQFKTVWRISNVDFKYIVWSWPFFTILLAGFVFVLFQQYQMNPRGGIMILPTTSEMLRVPMFIFTGTVNLLTFLYAGVLIFRSKSVGMNGLIDIVPQPSWVLMGSKLVAVLKVQFLLLTLVMTAGVFVQTIQGYNRYEWGHYLFELYVLQWLHFSIWACLAIFVHTLFRNMYLSFFILMLTPVLLIMMPDIASYLELDFLRENVFIFNSVPGQFVGFDYSDFNGYGTMMPVYFAYKFYWLTGGILMLLTAVLCWKRMQVFTIKERWHLIRSRFRGSLKYVILLAWVAFISLGSTIYYNEHFVSKTYYTKSDEERVLALNEKRYGHLVTLLQPKIAKASITMDLYPETRDFVAKGYLVYVNKVDRIIDTIVIAKSFKEITNINISYPHSVVDKDEEIHMEIIKLDKGLALGDSLLLNFEIKNYPNSIFHDNSRVLTNGTYITSNILPILGVRNSFLTNQKTRDKYGLGVRKVKPQMPSDSTLLGYEFVSNNMDNIEYETFVSTSVDQQAFSMGTLVKEWRENDRNHYHFKSDGKIVNTISWMSGIYDKKVSTSKHQHLELYHQEEHDHNHEHMFHGLQSSLDFCSSWFGALPYDTLKLIEFPVSHGTYATVNGNLIPYSESQFLCDVSHHKNDKFNMPFYVAAHEIAHNWWGHRVDPANVQGGKLLTEAMADYIAIKVVEEHFSEKESKKLRKDFINTYFEIRARDGKELPLIHAKLDQDYINYRKGSFVLYSLSEYVGTKQFNSILAKYEKAKRHAPPPYPTSLDFVDSLRVAMPDSLSYLIKDLFETITVYDNQMGEVTINEQVDGKYKVDVNFTISKFRANGAGKKQFSDNGLDSLVHQDLQSLPLNDYVKIGFYTGEESNCTLIKTIEVKAVDIENKIQVELEYAPTKMVIDPNVLLIDGDLRDNEWEEGE